MKRLIAIILMFSGLILFVPANASKLSSWLNKQSQNEQKQDQAHRQQDLNFSSLDFRFQQSYFDNSNEKCRAYSFRSYSNPYQHGTYTVCYGNN